MLKKSLAVKKLARQTVAMATTVGMATYPSLTEIITTCSPVIGQLGR